MRKPHLATLAALPLALPTGAALASGGAEESGGAVASLVTFRPIVVPIIDSDRVEGALRVEIIVEAADAEAAARMSAELPVLRASGVAAASEFARLYASGFRTVNVEQLDHDLTAAMQAADPGVKRILIVEVSAKSG